MKVFFTAVVLLVLYGIFVHIPLNGIHYETSSGEHTGYVTAVEKSGIIFKTGRVYIKSELSSSQEDMYCVTDDNVYKALAEKSVNKEKVTVGFVDYLSKGLKHCEAEQAIITSVK